MELIHVVNRGVDKRNIFKDDEDRYRFIHDLFEFNDEKNVQNNFYSFKTVKSNINDIRYRYIGGNRQEPRKLIVNLHAFCLMNNHYHLLVSSLKNNGLPLFMRKINGGYSRYFNQKNKRRGSLFESRYKAIKVKDESHFLHLPFYIHLNPLDYSHPTWRERRLVNHRSAFNRLLKYKWSSHLDYLGIKNFPSLTQRDFLNEFFGGPIEYKKSIYDWLAQLSTTSTISDIVKDWE